MNASRPPVPAPPPDRWRRAYVVGLGLSGRAAARLLLARGVEVVASDRRPVEELELGDLAGRAGLDLRAGTEEARLPDKLDALVVSPGVSLRHPLVESARAARVPVVAEVELAARLLDGTIVAVTGSNGKSTTTALTGALVAASGRPVEVCGNIGVPLASVVEGAPGRVFVVELSSFQLETIDRFRPDAAALLNLSPDHLDRHGDLGGYLAAKRRIFENQGEGDVGVVNADDLALDRVGTAGRRRLFSRLGRVADGCWLAGEAVVESAPGAPDRALFHLADLRLAGPHNLENAMAAALLARAVGVAAETIPAALAAFRGLPHRLELVGERDGVAFYDDSKGTNIGATSRSIEGFADSSVHLILGGRNKGADFRELREVVARKARRAYLIGESAGALERALAGTVELVPSGTLEAAVGEAAAAARPGESVVLSPACASFDQFRDFVDRGRRFRQAVERVLGAAPAGRGAG
jgi:UDP-N-acetylmuramoylalanine--D-glutamate ligase